MAKYETVKEFRENNREIVDQIKDAVKEKRYAQHMFLSRKYRHYHIAYCMLRGTAYERIEAKVREKNEPDWGIINDLIKDNEHLRHVPRERQEPAAHLAEA
jgi:hypothetical protein